MIGPEVDTACLGVAVSGGPDSMALLALAVAAWPKRVRAATVDHGLRASSADEAKMVAHWCADHGIPHSILRPEAPITGSVQAAARAVRYALLEAWRGEQQVDWLMTAHHADDQCETVMMRLNRGSGVAGLAGVRARNGQVLRPLLGWRRSELVAVVEARRIPYALDPSNSDLRFDRAAMRAHLAQADWIDPVSVARSAAALADAEAALDWMVATLAQDHVRADVEGTVSLLKTDFPHEIRRRLVLHMLALMGNDEPPRGDALDKAIVQISRGRQVSMSDWLLSGGEVWRLRRAPARKSR
nr:tRNA lysidine(34) synthetase TilS [Sphingobium subterraneum]